MSPLLLVACLASSLSGMASASPLPSASDQLFCLQQLVAAGKVRPNSPLGTSDFPKQTCGTCSWSIVQGSCRTSTICGTASNGHFKVCVDHGVCTDGTLLVFLRQTLLFLALDRFPLTRLTRPALLGSTFWAHVGLARGSPKPGPSLCRVRNGSFTLPGGRGLTADSGNGAGAPGSRRRAPCLGSGLLAPRRAGPLEPAPFWLRCLLSVPLYDPLLVGRREAMQERRR